MLDEEYQERVPHYGDLASLLSSITDADVASAIQQWFL